MTKLYYFDTLDIMAKVEYIEDTNSIRYATHKRMMFQNRLCVEQYILTAIAPTTRYYRESPSFLVYMGADMKLAEYYVKYKAQGMVDITAERVQEINNSVKNLIAVSMREYYSEQIGDVIAKMKANADGDDLRLLRNQLADLVLAYNMHSEKKITIESAMRIK